MVEDIAWAPESANTHVNEAAVTEVRVGLRACSYGQKLSRLARKHFDKFTSEISPSYENSTKSYLAFI